MNSFSKDRKTEVKRLENALERLLNNLGNEVEPLSESRESEPEEAKKPTKTNAEDNKHGTTTPS